MIIVKLQGGLGNQMFQYAAARACSPAENVLLDLSFLENNTASTEAFTGREYRLIAFKNIKARRLRAVRSKIINDSRFHYRLLKKAIYPRLNRIGESNVDMIGANKNKRSFFLDGYFQNEAYFKHIRTLLLHEFSFPDLPGKPGLIRENIKTCKTSVAVHVRRGDYTKPRVAAYHGVLPQSYYTAAIAFMDGAVPDAHYFIFSDDITWCRENLGFLTGRVTFNDTGEDWADLALMSSCHHQIIANSSYSWWAAWLNPAKEKVVIAPEKWFADSEAMKHAGGIVPDHWIKV